MHRGSLKGLSDRHRTGGRHCAARQARRAAWRECDARQGKAGGGCRPSQPRSRPWRQPERDRRGWRRTGTRAAAPLHRRARPARPALRLCARWLRRMPTTRASWCKRRASRLSCVSSCHSSSTPRRAPGAYGPPLAHPPKRSTSSSRSTTSAQCRRVRGCADRLTVARLVPGWVRAECAGGHAEGDGVRVGMGGKAIGMPFGQRFGTRFGAIWTAIWNAAAPECIRLALGHAAR